jgi:hypothetical protein
MMITELESYVMSIVDFISFMMQFQYLNISFF